VCPSGRQRKAGWAEGIRRSKILVERTNSKREGGTRFFG
jgi:hypothetical protein